MDKRSVAKNYRFLAILLVCMVAGALVGWFFPKFGHSIAFLGKVFINMMFCIVVPLVFASIAGSVANMDSKERAGKIMGSTIATFVITGAIAAVIMFVLMKLFPPVLAPWSDLTSEAMGEYASITDMVVNFFTAEDFVGLLSRKAMLPLIVFSILFGFSVQMTGGKDSIVGKWLTGLSDVMMKFVQIITYYAPIAFFAIFADLVATYGAEVAKGYGRALVVYYPLCFLYIFTAFPLFARFGGGKGAARIMFRHVARPAIVSLGTCSSVATMARTGCKRLSLRRKSDPAPASNKTPRPQAAGSSFFLLSVSAEHVLLHRQSRRRYRQAAQGGLPELHRHPASHFAHAVNDLVHRDAALHACQGHVRAADGVHRAYHVPLYAGHLHQAGHRVAHQAHQVLQRHGHRMADLLAIAAPQRRQRPGRHGGSGADLRLTSAGRAGNAGPERNDRPDAGGHIQRLEDLLLRCFTGLIQRHQHRRQHAAGPRRGTAAPAPPAARRRPPPWEPPRSCTCRRWTLPRSGP